MELTRGTLRGNVSNLGNLVIDVQSGSFGGNSALQSSDFEASATAINAAMMSIPSSNGQLSTGSLNAAGLAAVNTGGRTQVRIYFTVDDNDDGGDDQMGFRSGDHSDSNSHPRLIVTYQP